MRRLALVLPAALLAALASLAPGAPAVSVCAAAGSHHAALVVEHADGSTLTRCVAFDTATISGEELLNRSGVAWSGRTFGSFGDAVCALDGEPAQYIDCPGKDRYWAVFVARGAGSWQLANVGISSLAIHDGDAEGFRFDPASGVPAAPLSAAGVCAAAATPVPRRSVAPGSGASPAPTGGSPGSPGGASQAATPIGGAAATAVVPTAPETGPSSSPGTAALGARGTAAGTAPPQAPAPTPPGGVDLGLLMAATVGGGLAGLALLRLIAGRRPGR